MAYAFRKQEAAPSNGQPLFFSFIRQAFTYLGFHYRSQLTVTWTPTSFWPLLEQQSEHEPLKQMFGPGEKGHTAAGRKGPISAALKGPLPAA